MEGPFTFSGEGDAKVVNPTLAGEFDYQAQEDRILLGWTHRLDPPPLSLEIPCVATMAEKNVQDQGWERA